MRKVEIYLDGVWNETSFNLLKNGDKFRMFEPVSGDPVKDESGFSVFIARSDLYKNDDGILAIDTDGVKE